MFCGAETGLYDLISSSCAARVNNNPRPSELAVSVGGWGWGGGGAFRNSRIHIQAAGLIQVMAFPIQPLPVRKET